MSERVAKLVNIMLIMFMIAHNVLARFDIEEDTSAPRPTGGGSEATKRREALASFTRQELNGLHGHTFISVSGKNKTK